MLALATASAFSETGVEAETRRQHQALLRAGDGDVDAPGIVLIFQRAEAGDGVDHQQRRMLRRGP